MSSTLDWHSAANSQYTSLSLCHRECGKWAAGLLVTRTVLAQTYLSMCFFNLTSSFNWNYILLFYLVFCVSGEGNERLFMQVTKRKNTILYRVRSTICVYLRERRQIRRMRGVNRTRVLDGRQHSAPKSVLIYVCVCDETGPRCVPALVLWPWRKSVISWLHPAF